MTTKTNITLPPLPMPIRGSAFVRGHAPDDDRLREWGRAAVEADRQDQFRDATKMVPSDEEIQQIMVEHGRPNDYAGTMTYTGEQIAAAGRALLSRYDIGQPAADLIRRMRNRLNVLASEDADMADQADAAALVAEADALLADQPVASAEADREKLMRAIVEAGQRDGIIRADLETASVTECLHILECLSQPAASAEPLKKSEFRKAVEAMCGKPAAPVAQEPVVMKEICPECGHQFACFHNPYINQLRAAPAVAQAQPIMPPLTDSMRAVLRNENDVYGDEDALYAALCDAAQTKPSAQDREDDEALADTQRAIIEAAERRGYARAEAENVGYRTDAGRYRFIRPGDKDVWCSSGDDLLTGDQLDAAIDAARAVKGADHG